MLVFIGWRCSMSHHLCCGSVRKAERQHTFKHHAKQPQTAVQCSTRYTLLPAYLPPLLPNLHAARVCCRRVQAAIAEGRQQGAGSVRQALCAALADEVTDFYRLMAVLETQLTVPQPMPGAALACKYVFSVQTMCTYMACTTPCNPDASQYSCRI
jgi:hypothetical protein